MAEITIRKECRVCYFFKQQTTLMGFCLEFDKEVCIAHEGCIGWVRK